MAPSSYDAEDAVGDYKPGSIRKIKLKNFLTYSDAVINPGPRFNMVIGANGTGKSSILCAICLGLGGDPKVLGRADDARSFIMNGKEIAFIEVELTPHPGQPTHIFQRKIDRNKGSERGNGRGASTCYINDEKVSLKDIQKVVKETYHISIDNLCTFLPQDKVGNFSGFDQQSLLLETEKTLSGTQHLYHAHQQLIEKESELNSGDNDVDTLVEKINKLTTERDRFEREKARMEERNQAVAQKELLEKKIGWLDFNEKRIYVQGLRDKKNEYKEKLNQVKAEVAPLEEKQEALQKREHDLAKEFKAHDTNIQKKKKDMANHHSKGDKLDENIDQALADLESIGAEKAQKKKAYEQQAHKVESLKAQRDGLPPAEEIESAFKEASQKKQATHKDLQAAKKVCHNLHSKFGEFETKAEQLSSKLAKLQDEKARRRERVLAGHDNLRKIMQWLEKNRKNFRRKVWGPIACELAPRSANAAAFLNEHVANATLKSFVVEDKSDYDLLYNEIRNGLSIPINITVVKNGVLEPIQRMYSESKMKKLKEKHGIIGYLDESFTAPDAVMQALINSSRVHQVLVGGPETQKSIDDRGLLRYLSEPDTELGQNKPQSSCVFASEGQRSRKYTTQISRYSKKPNTNIDDIGPARMLAPGVDPKKRDQLKDQLKSIHDEMAVLRPQLEDADGNKAKLEEKGQELGRLAASKKEDMETYNKVRTKLSQAESKLADLEKDLKADDSKKKREQIRKIMNSVQNLVRAVEQHGTCHDKMIDSTTKCAGKRIDKDTVTQLFRETTQLVLEKRQTYEELVTIAMQTKNEYNKKKAELQALKNDLEEKAPLDDADLKAKLEELPDDIHEARAALEEIQEKIDSCHYDPNVERQYDQVVAELEREQDKLDLMQGNKDSLVQAIEQIREPWESALVNSISEVNELFVHYMSEMGYTGEVRLKKGEESEGGSADFKNWGIEIRVSFREGVKAQILSAQVQSGGERSVSTIMYLMALQERMVSPFRCVDEINQGLDDRNERLVFRRIVANSTRPPKTSQTDHSGQYFLITPKLLPNLIDMETEATTVLIVTNGPYNFDSPEDFDVDAIVGARGSKRAIEAEEDEENSENFSSVPRRNRKNKKRRSSEGADENQ